jgi:hypothetical protein
VIEEQPYLWAALRQRVDPALAYVRSAAPDELARVWRTCQPWPWLLVGSTSAPGPRLAELVDGGPIPVHWVGRPPPTLPGRPALHGDWTELVGALDRLRDLTVHGLNGVRLLRNRGLRAPDGRIVQGVEHVEGLLAAPDGLPLSDWAAVAVQDEIGANALPLHLEREGALLRLGYPPAL